MNETMRRIEGLLFLSALSLFCTNDDVLLPSPSAVFVVIQQKHYSLTELKALLKIMVSVAPELFFTVLFLLSLKMRRPMHAIIHLHLMTVVKERRL